jgi:large subunit ribosomal protein L18
MKSGPRFHVKPRRHRQRKTDYHRRLRLLRSKKTRIVVRRSLQNIRVQFIDYNQQGDEIVASAISSELKSTYQWKYSADSTPAAYLTGLLAGARAKKAGIEEGVLDIGLYHPTKGSRVFAALKGVLDAGVDCPHDEEMLPSKERLAGAHLNKDIKPSIDDIHKKISGGNI